MNSVDRVKSICKERKIPISRLEKDLGYANGYIGQLKKGTFPADRLSAIANYLNVSSDFLLTGEQHLSEPELNKKDQRDIKEILANTNFMLIGLRKIFTAMNRREASRAGANTSPYSGRAG